jgi:multidrug resistance efflux pump
MTEQSKETDTLVKNDNVPSESDKKSVSKGALGIFLVILILLVWNLFADRFTPYTNQARIQGYVVGVAPKVAGVVTQVWVTNNTRVDSGEHLFEVDPSQYKLALDKANSNLENARRQVGAGNAAVESAQANLRAAIANQDKAQKDYTRLQRLRKEDSGTISIRRLEVSQATLDQARAQVAAARANIQQAIEQKGGNNDENNAILNTAITAVEKAELDLENTIIKAESRGVITDLRAEVGQYAGTGSPIMTLIALEDVWINAEFTENNLGNMEVGLKTEILFDVVPGEVFPGSVRSIGLGVSANTNQPAPGTLPSVSNDRDWLRQAQRFPVVIGFDPMQDTALLEQIRVGGQASVIVYVPDHTILEVIGKFYIRLKSWLSYIY